MGIIQDMVQFFRISLFIWQVLISPGFHIVNNFTRNRSFTRKLSAATGICKRLTKIVDWWYGSLVGCSPITQ